MTSKKVLVRLPTTGKQGDVFLLTQLQNDGKESIELTLTDGDKVWHGRLSESDLLDLAEKINMDFVSFVEQTVAAFTGSGDGSLLFQFQTRLRSDKTMELVWKKCVLKDEIKFVLGTVNLREREDTQKALVEMFSHAMDTTQQLQSQIKNLETDNQRLSQERAGALKRLDKCVTAKEDLEKDLYFKFVSVLNSKKEKIRSLKKQLEDGISGTVDSKNGGTQADSPEEGDGDSDVPVSRQTKMPSPDEEDEDTDEKSSPSKRRRRRGTAAVPALATDTSLVLEEPDEASTSRVVRRPARQRTTKKSTPAKPVLPKVSSKTSDSSSSASGRKSSLRKSGSGNSDHSGGTSLHAEDLFEDL